MHHWGSFSSLLWYRFSLTAKLGINTMQGCLLQNIWCIQLSLSLSSGECWTIACLSRNENCATGLDCLIRFQETESSIVARDWEQMLLHGKCELVGYAVMYTHVWDYTNTIWWSAIHKITDKPCFTQTRATALTWNNNWSERSVCDHQSNLGRPLFL